MRTNAQLAPRAAAHPRPILDTAFARDVLGGFSRQHKSIPCTWLYDRRGSELFERITAVPEYYPTRTEILILRSCAAEIGALAGPGASLIELGSGSSHKTPLLLEALDQPACYVPIDISAQFLEESVSALQARFRALPIHPVAADFTQVGSLLLHAEAAAVPVSATTALTGLRRGCRPAAPVGAAGTHGWIARPWRRCHTGPGAAASGLRRRARRDRSLQQEPSCAHESRTRC